MNNAFVVLLMIFLHIIADYNLQGWLATAKTKDFWEQNAPEKMYKKDYIYVANAQHYVDFLNYVADSLCNGFQYK